MPSRLARLAAKQQRYLETSRKLASEGIAVHVPEEWQEFILSPLEIAIGPETSVYDLQSGIVAYRIQVRLLAAQKLRLDDCDMAAGWDNGIELESFDESKPVWHLGREGFSPTEVLNNRIEEGLMLHPGEPVEGLILATGLKPIPVESRTGSRAEVCLLFRDSLSREKHVVARAVVYRASHEKKQPQVRVRARTAAPDGGSDLLSGDLPKPRSN